MTAISLQLPQAGYHAFRHSNVCVQNSLRVPLKTIQDRIGHALTGSFTLDAYGHTLDWRENEEAAQKLGDVIPKAVAEALENSDDSDGLTVCQNKKASIQWKWKSFRIIAVIGCGGWI